MATTLRLGNAVFCEYVGHGESNKFLLINVYSGDVVLPVFPSHILGALYFEFFPGNQKNLNAKLEFFRGEVKLFEATSNFVETKINEPAIISTPQFVIQFDQPTNVRAILTIKGFRVATVLTKEVRLLSTSSPSA